MAGGGPRRGPSKTELRKFVAAGLTQKQIAELWAEQSGEPITREAIAMAMGRWGVKPKNPTPRYKDLLPWRVKVEHLTAYDARMLRAEARSRTGAKLEAGLAKRLDRWKQMLAEENAVVAYDEALGFVWLYRKDTDADLIRVPDSEPVLD